MHKLSHKTGTYAFHSGLCVEKHRFDVRKTKVDFSLFTFILKVFDASNAFYYKWRSLAACKVYGKIAVLFYLNARFIAVDAAYFGYTFFRRAHILFALVVAYTYYDMVEKQQGTPHNRIVANGKWVETAHEYSFIHIAKVTLSYVWCKKKKCMKAVFALRRKPAPQKSAFILRISPFFDIFA